MIHVIATITLKPGRRDAFLAEFRKLVPQVHAEDGCLEYGPAVDVPTDIPVQEPVRADVVTVVERWASLAHLKAHLAAPHMDTYRAAVEDLVVETRIAVLEPV